MNATSITAAFFDLDKTICAIPTEQTLSKHLLQRNLIRIPDVLNVLFGFVRYNLHMIGDYDSYRRQMIHTIMKNMKVKEFEQTMLHAFEFEFKKRIFPAMSSEIKMHQKHKRKIVIISTAVNKIVEVFAKEIGADYHYSTNLEVKENSFTGNVLGNIYYGQKKKEAVLQYCMQYNIEPKNCYAYGDYYEDRHMMEVVGNAVAINPDKKLLKHAKDNNWKVLQPDFN